MHHRPPLSRRMGRPGSQHTLNIGLSHTFSSKRHSGGENLALQTTTADSHQQRFHHHTGHTLGLINCAADRLLSLIHVHNNAGLHACRRLIPVSQHLNAMRTARHQVFLVTRHQFRDNTAHFRGADVQHRNHNRSAARQRPHPRQKNHVLIRAHVSLPELEGVPRCSMVVLRRMAASSERRTTTRSCKRRSTATISRESKPP